MIAGEQGVVADVSAALTFP